MRHINLCKSMHLADNDNISQTPLRSWRYAEPHLGQADKWLMGIKTTDVSQVKFYAYIAHIGMSQVVFGAALLVWSGSHYEELHGVLRDGTDVVHPSAARWVGLATIAGTGAGLVAAVVVAVER